ncbi:MAG: spermidine synthase [Sporichthyaceae bacterium]
MPPAGGVLTAVRAHPAPGRPVPGRLLYVLVFVVGMASLGAEIAAARLIAPFFGASTIIWANTIGIVLVALSVGYWLGGRLADRHPNARALGLVVIAAAVLIAAVPFVARPFLDFSVAALDGIEAGAFVGSLLAVLVLLAVPIVLLGTVSPWAIRLAMDASDVEHAGRVAGRLYALSTAGSLFGTMLSALVLIPFLGTQRTFLAFALALALVGTFGLGRIAAALPALLAAAVGLPTGTVKAAPDGRVLYEAESRQQFVRVIERSDGDRILELNEGQAVHSRLPADGYLTGGIWDSFLVLPFAAAAQAPRRVAVLGNAAGTVARQYGRYWPEAEIDGVELDAKVSQVGYEYFDMGSNPKLEVFADDARPWLRRSAGGYDLIVVDAYHQPYIPFYLATTEFFALARERLAPGGILAVNVAHPEGADELERVLGRTMAEAFPTVLRAPVETLNTVLLGTEGPASAANLTNAAAGLPAELAGLARAAAARMGPRLAGGEVWTDDRAPVEWLIDKSLLDYATDN